MTKAILLGATGIAVAVGMLAFGYTAGQPHSVVTQKLLSPTASSAFSSTPDRKEVELVIRDYLLANPEILIEVQQVLEAKELEEQRISQLGIIKDAKDDIFKSPSDAVLGNPSGKVTIVEFFDYNCGFCKRAMSDMVALTKTDPELRFVLKGYPILGPDSQKAHIVAQALLKLMPEKYAEFHVRLLGSLGRAGEENAIKLAVSLGADEAKLRETMKDPSINETFAKTYDLANRLAITGTPSYVIGNEVVFGALGKDVLAEKIAAAKACVDNASC